LYKFQGVPNFSKYDFIVVDNPQNCYGPKLKYCEHFEVIPKIARLLDKEGIIIFDINKIGIQADGNGTVHITKPSSNIANGHCTIDKNVLKTIKWREGPEYHGREDSVFTSDIIKAYPNRNAYCPLILSKYIASGTGSYVT
jgi:hypothetical protein